MDTKHNEKRDQIRTHSGGGGSHLVAGIKGFGYGLYGGLTSIVTQTYEGVRDEGVEVSMDYNCEQDSLSVSWNFTNIIVPYHVCIIRETHLGIKSNHCTVRPC